MCVRLGLEDLGKPDAVVGVAEDRGHDHVPRRARRRLVPDALKQEQLGAGDLAGQRLPMPGREERVLRAVDDERRRPHLAEPGPHVIGAIQEPVVARARPPVGRTRDHAACRLAHRGLVEVSGSGAGSASAALNRSATGGRSSAGPGLVETNVSVATRSGFLTARCWAMAPPIDSPTR